MAREFLDDSSDSPLRRQTVFVADAWNNGAAKWGIADYARTHG